ncbi:preprotein translocase subunit SecY [Candidatus Mycoplasma mahonii]|uniref:preprotein translocase subunit SecY n=1 Tax=Candidatus Mycoplasma mahonii TaxID=3004105 RepID=UPI0026EC8E76|nr:preprotein translocase subunit SecY [Candidatus Mycoplasma mahonii]WKX02236.1 preprotein translocase subunit SecY [Candidatus Mycoplasma mahonii]
MSNKDDNWFDTTPEENKIKPVKRRRGSRFYFSKMKFKLNNKFTRPFINAYGVIASSTTKALGILLRKLNDKPLLKKILYTLIIILIFRIAATITIPGITIQQNIGQNPASLIGIMDMMGGGALRNFSIVALGISPYITASIIMQMLQSEVFPPLYRLSQTGPAGKRKINIITRIATLVFAFIQAITVIQTVSTFATIAPSLNTQWFKFFVLPVILIAGSMFALFLGEQITNNGVGNGTSLIIFSGIASAMPAKFRNAYLELVGSGDATSAFTGIINFIIYIGFFLFIIFIISYFYKAERHIPIQQTGSGMSKDVKQMSRLPIKLNPAGVMPVIFALTITMIPLTIAQFLDKQNLSRQWIQENMSLTSPLGLIIFVSVIFLFTVVMALVTFNPNRVADNFKKNGTFIPGIRPGIETEDYLSGIIIRLAIFSSFYLSIISALQYVEQIIGLSRGITFSGTSLIIMVSVAIETMGQLKARHQSVKISKARWNSVKSNNTSSTKGLLW